MEEDMLKKHMAACLVTTALLAAPALAQTSSGSSGSGASSAAASSGKFLSEEKPNQWRASKLVGVDVYGPNKEKVGDINEVLIDRNGKAEAIVIGVGGFLGIGEKNVALPFSAVKWMDTPRPSAAATNPPANTMATNNTAATGTATTPAPAPVPAAPGTDATGTVAATNMNLDYPDHGMINMSKDQLKNAPEFKYFSETQ
jgi:sporulation protein YlmC with PRC-barrel domain